MDILPIPSWDELFLRKVYLTSSKSKDARTKIGAVLVKDNYDFSCGYNGIPRGVSDSVPERYVKPIKPFFFAHAESNSVCFCARRGISCEGASVFTNGIPCDRCCLVLIQAGIKEVVYHKQWGDCSWSPEWVQSVGYSLQMFQEAGVKLRELDIFLNIQTLKDGKVITV